MKCKLGGVVEVVGKNKKSFILIFLLFSSFSLSIICYVSLLVTQCYIYTILRNRHNKPMRHEQSNLF